MPAPLRLVFAGTPDFAATHLAALLAGGHQVVAVYTQPDRPAGRGKKTQPSPVKQLATQHQLPVEQPLSFKDAADRQRLADYRPDLMVVVAYGLLLPQAVLDIPRRGCINVHASLLPRWRGAAPIQRAIAAGDSDTGVTIMQMEAGLDTGPMLLSRRLTIDPHDTGGSLHDKLAALGADALLAALEGIASDNLVATPQDDSQASYARKLSKAEAALDWSRPASALANQVRAFNPFPVSWTTLGGDTVRVWTAAVATHQLATGDQVADDKAPATQAPGTIIATDDQGIAVACGADGSEVLRLTSLQLPGKKVQPVSALLQGYRDRFTPGTRFGL